MKAAVYRGMRDVRIQDMPDPSSPGTGMVLLQVLAASICGTDVSEYLHGPHMIPLHTPHGASGHCGPTILGHEFVGRIVAVGEEVSLPMGVRVVAGAGFWCGTCRWCLEGRPNLCSRYFVYGLHTHGGLATYVMVPAKMCYLVPENCPNAWAAMAQPCAIALHAVRRSGAQPGDTVVLSGVGGIGAFLLAALSSLGVEKIIALDVEDARLSLAEKLGATYSLRVSEGANVSSTVRDWTAGQGAEVVIEASGAPSATLLALTCTRRGGRVLQVGLPSEPTPLPLRDFTVPEIDLVSTNGHVCSTDLPQALSLLATTHLAETILDRIVPLEAVVDDGLLALARRQAKGKVVVTLE